MKRIVAALSLLFTFFFSVTAQIYDKQCYYGISFEKSENRNWGYGELVVTNVEPDSRAEQAGIKVNDIIMEINGKATYLRDNATISDWLFDNPDPIVKFTIRNINTHFNEYTLDRECITVNSVDENYLATIFSFYSLENTRQLNFTLPLQIKPTPEVDYTDYHTFAFYNDGSEVTDLDLQIQEILTRDLTKIGLVKDDNDPDIWISLFYEHTPNPHFTGVTDSGDAVFTKRLNRATMKMENYPIYDPNETNVITKGQYLVKLGFTFFEKKYIDQGNFTQIWECNIQDYLSDNLTLEEYAEVHIPLIMMQYPYSTEKSECKYFVNFSRHNYTGIHFDADTMNLVNDVDEGSPAQLAGIHPGMRINKINDKKLDYSIDEVSDAYKKFITETQAYRDPSTAFTGIEGYKCMFWKPSYYPEISKAFNKSEYLTGFSYLYNFDKYVNPSSSNSLKIDISDGRERKVIVVQPRIKEATVIKAL